MKRTSIFLSIISLLCIFFSVSCKKKGSVQENLVTFDSIKVAETYYLFNDEKKPNCNFSLNFVFPKTTTDTLLLKKFQRIFVSKYFGESYADLSPTEAVEAYKKQYLANYKSLEEEYEQIMEQRGFDDEEDSTVLSYYEKSSNAIVFNKGEVLTFTVKFEDYTGGAHGSTRLSSHVVNLKTGEVLSEKDIFYEDYIDSITQIIVRKIMEKNEVKDPKELENVGFFAVEDIVPNGNFIVNEEGITYIFNQYEIAPYVMGVIKVHLPYNEISVYMKKDSPVFQLAD